VSSHSSDHPDSSELTEPSSPDISELIHPYERYDPDSDETFRPRRRAPKREAAPAKQRKHEAAPETAGGGGLTTTYQPSRHEAGWLFDSLGGFFTEELITDVLYHVKGGKEASVYCCRAEPSTGVELLAAKVYRPKQFRSLSNDAMYREGRALMTAQGRALLGERGRQAQRPDRRMMKAVAGKSAFGQAILHGSWLSYEFSFLERMYRAGASVPKPVAIGENAILMGFIGDEQMAAPTIGGVHLDRREAKALLDDVLNSIELMLVEGFVHGDLSAYNIMYWQGKVVLIDFPQVTDLHGNPHAREILWRDVTRVCEYFARQGAYRNPDTIAGELWDRYGAGNVALETYIPVDDE
jgi:RIO kinase 1